MDGKKKRYVGSGHHRWRSSPQAVITAGGLYRRRSSPLAVLTVLGLGGHERIPAYTTRIPRKYQAYTARIPRVYHKSPAYTTRIPRIYHAYTSAHQRIPAYTARIPVYTVHIPSVYIIYIYTKATAMMLHLFWLDRRLGHVVAIHMLGL